MQSENSMNRSPRRQHERSASRATRWLAYPPAVRLWSIHPLYLDSAGLVALWREGLLAQAVLAGKTRGYKAHPQLIRFLEQRNPRAAIAAYLHAVADEAEQRAYAFDRAKIVGRRSRRAIDVTDGQLRFELSHLKRKVLHRNAAWFERIRAVCNPSPHPSFGIIPGGIAEWERGAAGGE